MRYHIYKVTNKINDKAYIGQTKNHDRRWSAHKSAVKRNKPEQVLHKAMIKYGIDNFCFEIICTCIDQDAANEAEAAIIIQENSQGHGYNISNGGQVAPKTEEFKRKLSEKGKVRFVDNPECFKPMKLGRAAYMENFAKQGIPCPIGFQPGRDVTNETREKISAIQKGRIHSKVEIENRAQALRKYYSENGKKSSNLTQEAKDKISIAIRNRRILSEDEKLIISEKFFAGLSLNKLSKEYGVTRKTIANIVSKIKIGELDGKA